MDRSRRRGLALLLVLVLALLGPGVRSRAAQQDELKDTIYTSPLWGYTIRWHSSEWTVANDITSPDLNLVMLSDSHGNVITFTGANDFNGNAKACLDDMRATFFSDPEHTEAAPYETQLGDPVAWHDKQQAYVLLLATTTADDGTADEETVYLECQTLVPGQAVFQRVYSGSADAFDQWYDQIVDLLESVYLPASAWYPEDKDDPTFITAGYAPLRDHGRYDAIFFPPDDPRLLIGLVEAAGDRRAIAFENVSDAPVTIDPTHLALVSTPLIGEGEGQVHEPYAVGWDDGFAGDADGTRTLAPGERVTALVDIAPIDESTIDCNAVPYVGYTYREPDGTYADFANVDVTSCRTGSAAGEHADGGKASITASLVSE